MENITGTAKHLRADWRVPAAFALIKVVLHLASNGRYGYFRDELYYLDCARHLDWGYVDHPPLAMFLLALFQMVMGDSLLAIRIPAMLIGAAAIFITGMVVREMGGGRWAQALACLAVLMAPVYLVMGTFYSMNPFDQFFWVLGTYVVVRLVNEDNPRLWLWFGVVAGLGLQNKLSMLFFGGALSVALVLSPQRKYYLDKHLYLGGAIAALIILPNILWEARHDWVTLEFMRHNTGDEISVSSALGFLTEQLLMVHPFSAPIWLAGLCYGLFSPRGRKYVVLAVTFLVVLLFLMLTGAKPYYLSPAFPMVLALGAVAFERMQGPGWRRFPLPLYSAMMLCGGLLLAPYALPLLPPATFLAYQSSIGIAPAPQESNHTGDMPQHFGDRFGWPEMAALVTRAYESLPEQEQAHCEILVENSGQAGALYQFGRASGLPQAVCGHNNQYYWMPDEFRGETVLVLGYEADFLQELFESVEEVGRTGHPFAMPYENNRALCVCHNLKISWETLRMRVRNIM